MKDKDIVMGTIPPGYKGGIAQTITLCVTEECNLRCKYCYMTQKNAFHRMSIETAKTAVDYFLAQPYRYDAVIWDFIGGEPTLEMALIDEISDYIKKQMYLLKHPWFNDYIFNIGTNGTLYAHPDVQNYIKKNAGHLSITITIDGTKEKHDLQRVYKNGEGSYDDVVSNVALWQKQFPGTTTKVTFSSEDLKYLKDSILHLWNLGLNRIPANVVFEDVWKEGDDVVFEDQLRQLADYILEHHLWDKYSVRFFDPTIGFPLGKNQKKSKFCGTGTMMAVDCKGNIFPCIRFLDFCMKDGESLKSGSIYNGLYQNTLDAFNSLSVGLLNDNECAECPVASGCFSCSGCNYTYSETKSIFTRTKYNCKMHKAQIRANEYFWDKLGELTGEITPYELNKYHHYQEEGWALDGASYLLFLLGNNPLPHCQYSIDKKMPRMTKEIFEAGIAYAHEHHMIPVFIGDPSDLLSDNEKRKVHIEIRESRQSVLHNDVCKYIPIYLPDRVSEPEETESCILLINQRTLPLLEQALLKLAPKVKRINLKKTDAHLWNKESQEIYRRVLEKLNRDVAEKMNVFDTEQVKNGCGAGITDFVLAPDGKFYCCAGMFFSGKGESIGDLTSGVYNKYGNLIKKEKMPKCKNCENVVCTPCIYMNEQLGGFVNLAHNNYCRLSEIESEAYRVLFEQPNDNVEE